MINIILAVPALLWFMLVLLVLASPFLIHKRIVPPALALGCFLGWFLCAGVYVAMNPVAAPFRAENRAAYVAPEETTNQTVEDRSRQPAMDDEEREERNKELFDAIDQTKPLPAFNGG